MNYKNIASRLESEYPEISASLEGPHAALIIVILAAALDVSADEASICNALDTDFKKATEKIKAYDVLSYVMPLTVSQNSGLDNVIDDKSSARAMQIEALHRGKGDFANWFAIIVFLSCFAMIGVMLLHGASTINDSMRFYVLGFVQSVVMAIVGFYFGSSAPTRKNVPLQNQAK